MTLDEYQNEVRRTLHRPDTARSVATNTAIDAMDHVGCHTSAAHVRLEQDQLIACLGLTGEVGEVTELVKKHLGHGKHLDLEALKLELGDVRWYLTAIEALFGFTSEECAAANVEKLRVRYPTGFKP